MSSCNYFLLHRHFNPCADANRHCNYSYQFREKNPVRPVDKCPFLILARKTIILHLTTLLSIFRSIIYQVVAYGRLKTKESFKRLALTKSGRGHLQEVPNVVIRLGNFWYFAKLVAEERWSLTRGGHKRRFNCSDNRTQ